MNYIDLDGTLVETTTGQDKVLSFLYTNIIGRMLLKLLVDKRVSVLSGRLLDSPVSTLLIQPFIKKNGICMKDYENRQYQSFNDFFTRKVQSEKRPVCHDPSILISPCDCKACV